jgi:chromosomal replication initiator protein
MKETNYARATWKNLIDTLLETDVITKMSYDNWFKNSTGVEMNSKSLTVQTEDTFSMQWINDNFKSVLETNLSDLLGQQLTIHFVIKDMPHEQQGGMTYDMNNAASRGNMRFAESMSAEHTLPYGFAQQDTLKTAPNMTQKNSYAQPEQLSPQHQMPQIIEPEKNLSIEQRRTDANLNRKFTFESFVSGSSNQLAYNIALAIAQKPGASYNPMFIYGDSGLGKTHLIQAIGNSILEEFPDKKVLYVTSESFVSDFVTSLQSASTPEFREKYRQIDVLIIDDIQFIVGKDKTQEEFFHTFNHLHQANKQIIISSDSQPSELTVLADRLRSRFSWGILTDIQAPELETRMAILHKKIDSLAEAEAVPEEIIEYIATNINTNVRDLEGALNGLFAHAVMLGKIDITLDLAVEALRSYMKKDNTKLTITKIQKIVAKYFHITPEELKSKSRKEPLTTQRHITIYLCKTLTDNSLQKIGKQFGNRDHTTIMNSLKKIDMLLKKDPDMKAVINELKGILITK